MANNPLRQLEKLGQSIWLDYIQRDLITSGGLRRLIEEDGLRGMTSNPSIFEKAIVESHAYDADIRSMALEGKCVNEVYEAISQRDVQSAADEFRPLYERTDGKDGYVSLEVNPHLAHDSDGTLQEARRLWSALNRPNVFIKVPATLEGLPVISQLISEGINVNVTLIFGLPRYRQVAEAYLDGIEARLSQGHNVKHVASVASFFVSRIDTLVDPILAKILTQGGKKTNLAKKMPGQVALSCAKIAYQIYKEVFDSERFKSLTAKGARVQRLLWASTGSKNPDYSDVKYVEALIGANTVNTLPLETLNAYRDHGKPKVRIERDVSEAALVLSRLPELGISLDTLTQQLEDEGVAKFNAPFDHLLETLAQRSTAQETKGKNMTSLIQMMNPTYSLLPTDIEGFDSLAELALDLRWSWNHYGDRVWRQLDPELWELTQNPWVVLQTVSPDHLRTLLSETEFRGQVDELLELKHRKASEPQWFQQAHPKAPLSCVAYFCMEFMLSEALPIYSGGLGNVAGDQLKAASDLGVPVIGIGLLYQRGYFRQIIDRDGAQEALFPYNDPGQLPITPVRAPNGEWLRLRIDLPGYPVWLRAWQVQVGRTWLYLLDSNDAANFPAHRGITSELYGGSPELRLKQEMLLGIGGWRLLDALDIKPDVCHLNEGHAAFVVLERARAFMEQSGLPFHTALAATRAGNLFTTHTAVVAGFDRFTPALIEQYLAGYAEKKLNIPLDDLLALGRRNPEDASESFNMAYLAIRGSGAVNGVSRLHGEVSRHLFRPLFPNWPVNEVPVKHVTNGVHMPTWDSAAADELWTKACSKNRWRGTVETLEQDVSRVSDTCLWNFRIAASKSLVEYTRQRLHRQLSASGAAPMDIARAKNLLDPSMLTLGFARRFATYKRPNLLLHDPERLLRILNNPSRPVQLILAGKAHPADQEGQALIKQWTHFIRRPEACSRVVFLADYDMHLTEHLVQGVDVWLNMPRRPWEACGTSGMKVLVNGGINLSELDGWWAEAYTPEVGWALGDGQEHQDDLFWDAADAISLYERLEQEVIPEFYNRDENGIPTAWVTRMRNSMAQLTPRFSANRAVQEYTEQHYLPAADACRQRMADQGALGKQIVDWHGKLDQAWDSLRFGDVRVETSENQHLFEIQVYLSDLDPDAVRVELYADGVNGANPLQQEMKPVRQKTCTSDVTIYRATVSADRPAADYTARVIPYYSGVAIPLETARILWQK